MCVCMKEQLINRMPCGMLAVMPNVPVKMPYMVTTDVLASMFTMTRKYITVIVV